MKKENTSIRLKKIMKDKNLRQVDILNLAIPYCDMYNVKMNKSDISQYCAGKTEPNQNKLFILGKALGVSEAWLMGFDVPADRSANTKYTEMSNIDIVAFEITGRSLQYSPKVFDAIYNSINSISQNEDNEELARSNQNISDILIDSNISYDDKAFALKKVIDFVLFDTQKKEIQIFYKLERNAYEDQMDKLIYIARRLNSSGLNKVVDYATDLSNVENYAKNTSGEKIVQLPTKQEQEYLMPQAAHERTDIEITDEMRKHDDDLMDNDEIWK